MKRILIDTNVYVAFKKGDPRTIEVLSQAEYIGVSTVVLGELFAGFRCGSREALNRRELDAFLDSPRVELIPVDEETAEFYATIFSILRAKGKPVPSNDLWIAASAFRHALALVTLDQHFEHIEGLFLEKL